MAKQSTFIKYYTLNFGICTDKMINNSKKPIDKV